MIYCKSVSGFGESEIEFLLGECDEVELLLDSSADDIFFSVSYLALIPSDSSSSLAENTVTLFSLFSIFNGH